MSSIDLTVFHSIQLNTSKLRVYCHDFTSCIAIRRLVAALSYYQLLQVYSNKEDQYLFINFINEIYPFAWFMQDLYHFMKKHDDELYEIMYHYTDNGFIKHCDIDSCQNATRHHRIKIDTDQDMSEDTHLNVYAETMDSFHYLLLHSFETGMRCNLDVFEEDDIKLYEQAHNQDFDVEFARFNRIITASHDRTRQFDRISSSKFNIQTFSENHHESEVDITYMDTIIQHLRDNNINRDAITVLVNYLYHEQFDTDSMDLDVGDGSLHGNISIFMQHKRHHQCLNYLLSLFKETKGLFALDFISIF